MIYILIRSEISNLKTFLRNDKYQNKKQFFLKYFTFLSVNAKIILQQQHTISRKALKVLLELAAFREMTLSDPKIHYLSRFYHRNEGSFITFNDRHICVT